MNLKILLAIAGIFENSAVIASNSAPNQEINFKEEAVVMLQRLGYEYELRTLWDKLSEAIKFDNSDKYISKRNQLKNLALEERPDDFNNVSLNEWLSTNYELLFSTAKDDQDRPKSELGTMLKNEGYSSSIDSICEFWPELTVSPKDKKPEIKQ